MPEKQCSHKEEGNHEFRNLEQATDFGGAGPMRGAVVYSGYFAGANVLGGTLPPLRTAMLQLLHAYPNMQARLFCPLKAETGQSIPPHLWPLFFLLPRHLECQYEATK